MIIIDGNYDGALESPYLGIPTGIEWPEPIRKLITVYEKQWAEWAEKEAIAETALIARDQAYVTDAALLIEAVRAGKPDPGTPTAAATSRALAYAVEATRQSAAIATATADKIRHQVKENATELLRQAATVERERLTTLATALDAARTAWTKAEDDARAIGDTLNWVIDMNEKRAFQQYRIAYNSATISWPNSYDGSAAFITSWLDALDLEINPPTSTTEPNRLTSFDA